MIWSTDIEHVRLKLVILGHFSPFTPLENPKISFLKKWKKKKKAGYINILHKSTKKLQSYVVKFLRYRVHET